MRVHRLVPRCVGSALFRPHPQPLFHALWERGVPHADLFGVLKRQLQHGRKLRFRTPHSPLPRGGRGGQGGEGVTARSPVHACAGGYNSSCFKDFVPNRCTLILYQSHGQSSWIAPLLQVPPASRGEPRTGSVPPASRREPRLGSVPPASRGNLKEGVTDCACFRELWLCDRNYTNCAAKVREASASNPPSPQPSPPLTRGERVREWGDSTRAGTCEL
jgi:hypothetical protein